MIGPALSRGNAYLGGQVWAWSLPSGFSCPGAVECLAYAARHTGRITVGRAATYRCYSATGERFPAVRARAWANFDAVKRRGPDEVAEALLGCLPTHARAVRIHAGGDFFSQDYFDGWLAVCRARPDVQFWAFTKSLDFWVARLTAIPHNLCLQASHGGKRDHLIAAHGLKSARVVRSVEEAAELRLEIATDDRPAMAGDTSFALLLKQKKRQARVDARQMVLA